MARRFLAPENLARIRHGSSLISSSSSSSSPLRKWAPLHSSLSSFSSFASFSSAVLEPEEERWSKLMLFVPGAITFGLGTWQIFRRQDKIKMLEHRRNKLGMEPINCNEATPLADHKDSSFLQKQYMESLEFRRVICRGYYDDKNSFFIGPRSRSISGVTENGYYLITPLIPYTPTDAKRGEPILVNRGWVPQSWRDKFLQVSHDDPVEEKSSSRWRLWSKKPDTKEVPTVEVVGVVRGSEKPSMFVPANDPTCSQWFYVDVHALNLMSGLPENSMYIEAINENVNPSNPYPLPKDINALIRSSVMPQDHLNYTLTWYSLSAAVTFMAFKRLMPKKSRR